MRPDSPALYSLADPFLLEVLRSALVDEVTVTRAGSGEMLAPFSPHATSSSSLTNV